ncbi:MAG: flavin-containing monooxygenase [Pseudomonadota bacterium]
MSTVAVVGGGPAGLAAAAMLRHEGVDVLVLEAGDEPGAAWAWRYDRLHLHTHRRLSGLPGHPIPREAGAWPARDDVRAYFREYARVHALDVRTRTRVERVDRDGDGWVLRTSAGDVRARRVVVATGLNAEPTLPDWPGRGDWPGELVHARDYRNPEPFRGRSVLVVGSGNTGAEVAVDLREGGAAPVWLAVRTPPHIVRRDTAGFPTQALGILLGHLPRRTIDPIARTLRRISVPDLTAKGLPPQRQPISRFAEHPRIPIVDVGIVRAVRDGDVEVVPAVEAFADGDVLLAGGRRLRPDAVVAATGYRPALESLVGHHGVLDDAGRPLVRVEAEHPAAPGLHFVGFTPSLGGALRLIGHESRTLARHVAAAEAGAPTRAAAVPA